MKDVPVIRWLGAFGKGGTLSKSARFEQNRPATDVVCAEPIWGGKSRLSNEYARIGLLVDMGVSEFVKGYAFDAYTELDSKGRRIATRNDTPSRTCSRYEELSKLGRFRNKKATWYSLEHGEVLIRNAHYRAVVIRGGSKNAAKEKAFELSRVLNLPLVTDRGQVVSS